jgi:hypothetical protein
MPLIFSKTFNIDYVKHINIKQIIIIQKYIRRYLIKKYLLIPSSYYQTKDWRKNRKWYKTGKSNECEKYQINLIECIIMRKLLKTYDRINMENNKIISKKNPIVYDDGYEWSENFDGLVVKNSNKYYFNLKFVCDTGGAQTRTLREVYHFIKYQIKYLIKNNPNNIYFINILDGDTSYRNMDKFMYLIKKYKHIKKYIFIGDLYKFQKTPIKIQIVNK